jgi:hypothetical protein
MHHPGVSRRGKAEECFHIVVPAKAGTHNHRTLCCAKVVQQHFLTMGRGVWVPAFAGTTMRECRHRDPLAGNEERAV